MPVARVRGSVIALVALTCLASPSLGLAQVAESPKVPLPADWIQQFKWRSIGPAAMGGRITAIAAYEPDPTTYFVGLAEGGLLKTTNNGTTFEHVFDHEGSSSVGSVAVAASDPKIVWVGTGEPNPRNSVSYGDGVYKSVDGGKTWKHMGLRGSFQVGKIVISPKDPNTVYVGALGRLYGPNKERGLYKTTDGGSTWTQVLYVDDKTGVVDIVMNPANPDHLVVATWDRQRDGFDSWRGDPPIPDGYDAYDPIRKYGPGSGIYRTVDGGKSFKKMATGLPTSDIGRIGLDVYRKDPKVIFAIIDCADIGKGPAPSRVYIGIQGEDAEKGGAKLIEITADAPAAKAGLKVDDVVTAVDGKRLATYFELLDAIRAHKAGDSLSLTVTRDKKSLTIKVVVETRPTEPTPRPTSVRALLAAATEDVAQGVRLSRIFDGGQADSAGLLEGDVIKEADKKPVKTSDDLLDILGTKKVGDTVKVTVIREGKDKSVDMKMQEPIFGGRGGGGGGGSAARPFGGNMSGQQQNVQDQQGPQGYLYGGVYRSDDGGATWKRINSLNPRPMYFSCVRVDPSDDKFVYVLGISMYRSKDGGKTFTGDGANRVHPDQHDLWINPRDGRHMVVGTDGGFYVTYNRMDQWDHLSSVAIGQFYDVAVDSSKPYRAIGGLQDNGTWMGLSMATSGGGPINEDWISVGSGDGFQVAVDPTDPDLIYTESQDGSIQRRNLRTGQQAGIRPRPQQGARYRFNWNTPFLLSAHNPQIFYSAGNYVFRSIKQGDDLRAISPEIARTGRGTASALAESPRNPDVLWVGTDDGNLWVTRDGGLKWTNVADKVGLPKPLWVGSVEASRFAEGRAYVTFDAHRSDDDAPYAYVTEDFGATWKAITANLPVGSTRVLREDPKNGDLLYVGTEFAAWASLDRGGSWVKLNNNLPTVKVCDYAFHPSGEMVAATHGRSLWVLDVTILRQLTASALADPARLYEPKVAVRWRQDPQRGSPYGSGHRKYFGENPARGVQLAYTLAKAATTVKLAVYDVAGTLIREFLAGADPGLHVQAWDLSRSVTARPSGGTAGGGAGGPGQGRGTGGETAPPEGMGGFGGFGPQGRAVPAGTYKVVLTVDGKEYVTTVRVENDPTLGPDQQDRMSPPPDETGDRG